MILKVLEGKKTRFALSNRENDEIVIRNEQIKELYKKVSFLENQLDPYLLIVRYTSFPFSKKSIPLGQQYPLYTEYLIVKYIKYYLLNIDTDLETLPNSYLTEAGYNYLKKLLPAIQKIYETSRSISSTKPKDTKKNMAILIKLLRYFESNLKKNPDVSYTIPIVDINLNEDGISIYRALNVIFAFSTTYEIYDETASKIYIKKDEGKKDISYNKCEHESEESIINRVEQLIYDITRLELIKKERDLTSDEELEYAYLLTTVEPEFQDIYLKLEQEILKEIFTKGRDSKLTIRKKILDKMIVPV